MVKWFLVLLLSVSASAQAAPASAEDDMSRFMAEKGLVSKLEQVSQSVIGRAAAVTDRVTDKAGELVVTAMGFLGVPYRRGGNTVESGFDCSGFVRAIYQQTVGLVLPRRATEQAAATQTIDQKDLRPGDLVFFNTLRRAFSHVGIYVGDGKFIHSPKPGAEVRVESMGGSYWQRRFDGARRVTAASPAAPEPVVRASTQPAGDL